MLIHPRSANAAFAYAPKQERRAQAASRIRGLFGPSLRLWADVHSYPDCTGNLVDNVIDLSPNETSITQTVMARQPICNTLDGNKQWLFDGFDDCLVTGNIDLTGTRAVTALTAHYMYGATTGIVFEVSTNTNLTTFGLLHSRGVVFANSLWFALRGDVGNNSRYALGAAGVGVWYVSGLVADKSQPGATEVISYLSGEVPVTVATLTSDNTNTFGNLPAFIGSRNDGAAVPLRGAVSQMLLLNRALSPQEMFTISKYVAQRAGLL